MKNQISLWKRIGISAVVGLASLVSSGLAAEPAQAPSELIGLRAREEATFKKDALGNEQTSYTSTLGLADPKNGAAGEWFRVYDNYVKTCDNTFRTEQVALRPVFNFKDFQVIPTVFASAGDSCEGMGSEVRLKAGDATIVVNAEERTDPSEARRLGFGLDYDFHLGDSTLTAKGGFDQVETVNGVTNYFVGGGVFDTKALLGDGRDRFGAFYRAADCEGDLTNTVLLTHGHWKDKNFGTRSYVKIDRNELSDFTSFNFTTLGAIHPRFLGIPKGYPEQGSYQWLEGDRSNGGIFDVSTVSNALNSERCPLTWRSNDSLSYCLSATVSDKAGLKSESFRADLGYSFGELKVGSTSVRPGVVVYASRNSWDTKTGSDAKNAVGLSGIVEIGKFLGGDVTLEVTGEKASDGSSSLYGGISASWKW